MRKDNKEEPNSEPASGMEPDYRAGINKKSAIPECGELIGPCEIAPGQKVVTRSVRPRRFGVASRIASAESFSFR